MTAGTCPGPRPPSALTRWCANAAQPSCPMADPAQGPFGVLTSGPRVYHIAAVGPNFNRIPYAVECRVALVFAGHAGTSEEAARVRLDPLVADESQAGPASIELVLHGRWRTACLPRMSRNVVVRVECASVSDAADPELHSHQLEMLDPMQNSGAAARARMYCCGPGAGPVHVVSYATLNSGMITVPDRGADLPRVPHGVPRATGRARPPSSNLGGYAPALIDPAVCSPAAGPSTGLPRARGGGAGPADDGVGVPPGLHAAPPLAQAGPSDLPIQVYGPTSTVGRPTARRARPKQRASVLAPPTPARASPKAHEYVPSIAHVWDQVEANRASVTGQKINVYGVVIEARGPCITRGPDLRSEVVIADMSSPSSSSDVGTFRTLALHRFEALPQDAIPFRAVGDVMRAHRVHVGVYDDHKAGTRMVQAAGKFYSTYVLWAGDSDSPDPIATVEPVRTGGSAARPLHVAHTVDQADLARVTELRAWGAAWLKASVAVDRPYMRSLPEVRKLYAENDLRQPFDLICCFEGQPAGATGVRFIVSGGVGSSDEHAASTVGHTMEVLGSDVARTVGDAVPFELFAPSWTLRPDHVPMWLLIRDAYCSMSPTGSGVLVFRLIAAEKTSTMLWLRSEAPEVRLLKQGRRQAGNAPVAPLPPPGAGVHGMGSGTGTGATLQPRSRPQIIMPSLSQVESHLQHAAQAADKGHAPNFAVSEDQRDLAEAALLEAEMRIRLRHGRPVISTHANEDKPVTLLAVVRQKTLEQGTSAPSFRVKSRICAWKSPTRMDMQDACKPWCPSCSLFVDERPSGFVCEKCAAQFSSVHDARLGWAFDVQLVLEDEQGTRMDMWVSGQEGSVFFNEATPRNLKSPAGAPSLKALQLYETALLKPQHVVDCSVKSYTTVDSHGIISVACKVFATALLPSTACSGGQ
jgi:hypothetical protein